MCQSPDNLYCGIWRKILKSCRDLDLGQTMPIIELVQDNFIYYKIFKFQVPRSIIFLVIVLTDTQTDTQTHNDEYCIVAFDKPQL